MIKFGSARIDENGRARGGKPGDQTGFEVMEQEAYWHRNGWRGIRAKDPNVANGIAWVMKVACASNVVGYNQDERYAIFWTDLREGVLTNADCSTLVPFCVIKAGVNVNVDSIWTGNLIERLMETGQFETFTVQDLNALCVGDILVDANLTSHTVVVTEGNSRQLGNVFDEPNPTLQWGSKGAEVRKLQSFFNEYGNANLAVDGDFGINTYNAVRFFQGFWGLAVDGIYGPKTHDIICFFLYMNGVQVV